MNLFKSVFIMFFSLFVFVSNGVAQRDYSNSLNQDFLRAVEGCDLEHVEYLLQSGVDVNATDEFGRNALMMLNRYCSNGIQMLNLLIVKEIDVNATDSQGRTALSYYVFPPASSYEREILLRRVGVQWTDADRRHLDFVREIHQSMKKNEDSFVREANEVFDEQSRDRFLRSRP